MRSATVLPLHGGKAPRWLFSRMVRLGERISDVIIGEFGADELLSRLADPNWFQALSCALGYDWHSSGTTTVTMGALKLALSESTEIAINGGKGKAGTNTPEDIAQSAERLGITGMENKFVEWSRLAAKVDSAMIYDDLSIYHHSFMFTRSGRWAVVQQGMEQKGSMAVRFQWDSAFVDREDFANEPHSGIEANAGRETLDLSYSKNGWARAAMVEALDELGSRKFDLSFIKEYPQRHNIIPSLDISKKGIEALSNAYELQPDDYKDILLTKGIGRKTIKSLAIVATLIYSKELAMRDPILYAYNVGGKDGIPYRISRQHYDSLIEEMDRIVDKANLTNDEKFAVLKRLSRAVSQKSESTSHLAQQKLNTKGV